MSSSAQKAASRFQQQAPENERTYTFPNGIGAFFAQQIWNVVSTNLRYRDQGTSYANGYTRIDDAENAGNRAMNAIAAPSPPPRQFFPGSKRG